MFVVQANSHFEAFLSRSVERTLSGLLRRSVPGCSHLGLLYLANYVTGTCILNARLLDHEDGRVSIRVKDYKSGQVQRVSFEAEEFVRRFVLHILPPGLRRMRYSGLFTPRSAQVSDLAAAIDRQVSGIPIV
jgi:hypothetical protein